MLSYASKKWRSLCITKESESSTFFRNKSFSEQSGTRMKTFYQIAFLGLAALIAATSFNCSSTRTVTVILGNRDFTLISSTVSVTSASDAESTATTDGSENYMTISMINMYGNQLSLFFDSNADDPSSIDNSSVIILSDNAFTQYAFPTEWAGRIYVSPNLNPDDSKIEDSYTSSSDIDVSYVNGYSVFITCSSEGTAVSDCNVDLFKQPSISCNDQVDDPVCLNFAQNIVNELTSSFFAACARTVYIYPNDNDVNVSNLKNILISCCVDASCQALSRQSKRNNTQHVERMRIRDIESHLLERIVFSSLLLPFPRKLRHRHYLSRYRIHG